MRYTTKGIATVVALLFFLSLAGPALAATEGTSTASVTATSYTPTIVQVVATAGVTEGTANPTPDGVTTVTVKVTCADRNGWEDLKQIDISLLYSGGTHTHESPVTTKTSAGDRDHQQAYFTKDFAMQYYDVPDKYTVQVKVTDNEGITSAYDTSFNFNYAAALGITVETATIEFGTLDYDKESTVQPINIHNSANTKITVNAKATDFLPIGQTTPPEGLNQIPAESLKGDKASPPTQPMKTDYAPLSDLTIPFGRDYGIGRPTTTYWQLTMPDDHNPLIGAYQSTISLQAA